jgi:ribonuclease P protein component
VGLSRSNRLKHRQDFHFVYQQGIYCRTSHLILRALQEQEISQQLLPPRIGISISQKVSKKAVIRNRIKRQIRAIFREFLPSIPDGWKIVVMVKPGATECTFLEFRQAIQQLLNKAGIYSS